MKKTIWKFGLMSGVAISAMMLMTVPFHDQIGFDRGYYVGYTTMVLAFLLVFFGIRSYRDNVGGGQITFGKAFVIGLGIMAIASVCYVITWECLYFTVMHDFMDKWAAYAIGKARASGATEAMIQQKVEEMAKLKTMMENPLINSAMVILEPLPVGLIMSLVSAGLLRKKRNTQVAAQSA